MNRVGIDAPLRKPPKQIAGTLCAKCVFFAENCDNVRKDTFVTQLGYTGVIHCEKYKKETLTVKQLCVPNKPLKTQTHRVELT